MLRLVFSSIRRSDCILLLPRVADLANSGFKIIVNMCEDKNSCKTLVCNWQSVEKISFAVQHYPLKLILQRLTSNLSKVHQCRIRSVKNTLMLEAAYSCRNLPLKSNISLVSARMINCCHNQHLIVRRDKMTNKCTFIQNSFFVKKK